jgi:endonuclease/exonuclease/phosphatase family metal-dependent hydrolase
MVNFLRKLNLWVVFFTLLAYAAPYISPAKVSLFLFFGLAFPWLLLANVIFILLWSVSRMRFWWFSTAVLLLGWTHLTAVFGVNFWKNRGGGVKTENTVRVLTYNLMDFNMPYHKDKFAAKRDLNIFLKKQDADIICLQEGSDLNAINTFLPYLADYPYKLDKKGEKEVFIFSRFPIINTEILDIAKTGNGCSFVDVQIGAKTVRVFTLHLSSNQVSDMANNLAIKGEVSNDDSWLEAGRMLMRVRRTDILRSREAEFIAANIKKSPYPVIICGDFNDIPVSYPYHVLAENLTDAFQDAAFGFSTTYSGKIPALKIDNILTSPTIKARSCQILKVKYSDHYPLTADLTF